jgi:5'-nucleotidase
MFKHVPVLLFALFLSACASQSLEVGSQSAHEWRVLVTNDDGIESEGIRQLAQAIAQFAEVVVVAPEKNESGTSQSSRLLKIRAQAVEVDMGEGISAWALNGTPSDCAAFGIRMFGADQPFDLVVSGVNDGPNYGIAYFYSGTIGAAFQALADGVPAVAVSQGLRREEWTTAVEFTVAAAKAVLAEPLPTGELLNINVPAGEIRGVKALPGLGNTYLIGFESAEDEQGPYLKPVITVNEEKPPGSDLEAYQQGYITVTPLRLDRNAYEQLDKLKRRSFIRDWNPGER